MTAAAPSITSSPDPVSGRKKKENAFESLYMRMDLPQEETSYVSLVTTGPNDFPQHGKDEWGEGGNKTEEEQVE